MIVKYVENISAVNVPPYISIGSTAVSINVDQLPHLAPARFERCRAVIVHWNS